MSKLRRYDPNNRPVFVTCVTLDRRPQLVELTRPLLAAYRHTRKSGVDVPAWVVLPDHLHAMIELCGNPLSAAVQRFKRKLSAVCYGGGLRSRIWQHRFWDHIIRDQRDFNRHVDYIHYNPVKHGLVNEPGEWNWSSFHKWAEEGWYQPDWGCVEREDGRDYGE